MADCLVGAILASAGRGRHAIPVALNLVMTDYDLFGTTDEPAHLEGFGQIPGELARVTGLSRQDAGLGNRALVKEGYATMPAYGTYRLPSIEERT